MDQYEYDQQILVKNITTKYFIMLVKNGIKFNYSQHVLLFYYVSERSLRSLSQVQVLFVCFWEIGTLF